ncbi:MAG: DUF362 domain-containing protein [Chitinispirillales bacterium]|jgi:uncharacterized protein (DUF362 family)|nr:DUF362 domain-containing protein [Chitinispirillales bacterium]
MNKPKVAIVHNPDIGRSLAEALECLGNLSGLFTDKHVAIKPDDTLYRANDTSSCTQADTMRALIKLVKRYNPYRVTVAGGSNDGETDYIFELLGINNVISEEETEFFDLNHGPFKCISLNWGPVKEVVVNPRILSFDTIISLAQFKEHPKAQISLTMENTAMSIPANDYYGHPEVKHERGHKSLFSDLHGFIAGMCQRFPIQLSIINGHPSTVKGIRNIIFDSQLVVAGRDFVAVDSVGARIMGIERPVVYIEQAAFLGLGQSNLRNMDIVGISVEKAAEIFVYSKSRI